MKILIVEDEVLAARRLQTLLKEVGRDIEILAVLDSIEDSVDWLRINDQPDLIFMDIMLADGQSFEIFDQVEINAPVIFTTAYDEFAIKAFKVNSIDYLLKPVEAVLLSQALKKYNSVATIPEKLKQTMLELIQGVKNETTRTDFKSRFLVKSGTRYIPVSCQEAAYFNFENKLTFLTTRTGKKYMLDLSLDELEALLDPHLFFRLSRQYIASFSAIKTVHTYFNGKLKIYVEPEILSGIISSRERAPMLKLWLDR